MHTPPAQPSHRRRASSGESCFRSIKHCYRPVSRDSSCSFCKSEGIRAWLTQPSSSPPTTQSLGVLYVKGGDYGLSLGSFTDREERTTPTRFKPLCAGFRAESDHPRCRPYLSFPTQCKGNSKAFWMS